MPNEKKKLCFVLMPFKDALKDVYWKAIKPACLKAGFDSLRVDELKGSFNINQKVIQYIFSSDVILADLTEWNPNVFYELGVAHAIDNKTILIIQKHEKLPFDVSPYKCIHYEQTAEGLEELRECIIETLKSIEEWRQHSSNPVQDFKPFDAFIPKSMLDELRVELRKKEALLAQSSPSAELTVLQKELARKTDENLVLQRDLQGLRQDSVQKHSHVETPLSISPPAPASMPNTLSNIFSHVDLIPSRIDPRPAPTLIVIAKEIAQQWGIPEAEISVFESLSLGVALFALGEDRHKIGNKTLTGATWVTPEMFFTSKLFYLAQKNALPGCQQVEGMQDMSFQSENITPILPIQPWLLQYLHLEELRNRFAFERINDGILARLSLPLRGTDGKGRNFVIKKEYRNADNDLQAVRQLPVMEIWPDFKAKDWKAYYTYYSQEKGAKTFYAAPVAPGAEIELQKKTAATTGINYQPAQKLEIKSYKDNLLECETPNTGARLEQITKLDRFPEAFACFYDVPNQNLKKFEMVSAGLILLEQPDERYQTDDWKIGIDFAPDITNVYYSDGRIQPRPIEFRDHFVRVTDSAASDWSDTICYRFLAGRNAVAPFMTIYHDFRTADPAESVLRPVLDGHIFFKNEEVSFDSKNVGIHAHLKWGNSREDRKRAHAFLSQLCLQCAAEAASQGARYVSWRYSFPAHFSVGERLQYDQVWSRIIKACNALTGLTKALNADIETWHPIIPESTVFAFCQFFADNPNIRTEASFGNKGICINIGDEETEISIWHDNILHLHSSIRFAARYVLLNLFYQNPLFLNNFEKEREITGLIDLANAREEIKFHVQLDVLLKERGRKWLEHLHLNAGEPVMIGFMQLLAFAFSGLMFYVGQMLNALNKDPVMKFLPEFPNVFIGSHGVRILDLLAGGERYNIRSPINSLFKTMLLAGSGFKTKESDFQICASPEPRAEIAYGLVSDEMKLKADDLLTTFGVIAGEKFVEHSAEQSWQEKLTVEGLHGGLKITSSLEQFAKFLETFRNFTDSRSSRGMVRPLQDYGTALYLCRDALAQKLAASANSNLDDIKVEPLFIIALKHFLDMKIKQWAQTQQPV